LNYSHDIISYSLNEKYRNKFIGSLDTHIQSMLYEAISSEVFMETVLNKLNTLNIKNLNLNSRIKICKRSNSIIE